MQLEKLGFLYYSIVNVYRDITWFSYSSILQYLRASGIIPQAQVVSTSNHSRSYTTALHPNSSDPSKQECCRVVGHHGEAEKAIHILPARLRAYVRVLGSGFSLRPWVICSSRSSSSLLIQFLDRDLLQRLRGIAQVGCKLDYTWDNG